MHVISITISVNMSRERHSIATSVERWMRHAIHGTVTSKEQIVAETFTLEGDIVTGQTWLAIDGMRLAPAEAAERILEVALIRSVTPLHVLRG
jgi:hypothetical protein